MFLRLITASFTEKIVLLIQPVISNSTHMILCHRVRNAGFYFIYSRTNLLFRYAKNVIPLFLRFLILMYLRILFLMLFNNLEHLFGEFLPKEVYVFSYLVNVAQSENRIIPAIEKRYFCCCLPFAVVFRNNELNSILAVSLFYLILFSRNNSPF